MLRILFDVHPAPKPAALERREYPEVTPSFWARRDAQQDHRVVRNREGRRSGQVFPWDIGDELIFLVFIRNVPTFSTTRSSSTTFASSQSKRPRGRPEFRDATSRYARRPRCKEPIFQLFTRVRRPEIIHHIACESVAIFGSKYNGRRQSPIR